MKASRRRRAGVWALFLPIAAASPAMAQSELPGPAPSPAASTHATAAELTRQGIEHVKTGDELVIRDVWGAITYQGEGYFIAGGAGLTPFMAILRDLHQKKNTGANKLFFSNKTERDIIYKEELRQILGANAVFTLTREKSDEFEHAKIDRTFLEKHVVDFKRHFYVCGPDPMVAELTAVLQQLGATADSVIFEK